MLLLSNELTLAVLLEKCWSVFILATCTVFETCAKYLQNILVCISSNLVGLLLKCIWAASRLIGLLVKLFERSLLMSFLWF